MRGKVRNGDNFSTTAPRTHHLRRVAAKLLIMRELQLCGGKPRELNFIPFWCLSGHKDGPRGSQLHRASNLSVRVDLDDVLIPGYLERPAVEDAED